MLFLLVTAHGSRLFFVTANGLLLAAFSCHGLRFTVHGIFQMSFLDNLFKDPFRQEGEPRRADEFEGQDVIVSPDTRRASRVPPGQTRTRKWPVLDAHGTPQIDLETWQFEAGGAGGRPPKRAPRGVFQFPPPEDYAHLPPVTPPARLPTLLGGGSTRTVAALGGG